MTRTPAPAPAMAGEASWWIVAPPVLLTALFFFPVTQNFFYADDFIQLFAVADGDLLRGLFRLQAGHTNVAFNAVTWVAYRLFGPTPAAFQWLAFLTHLLNVALLARLLAALFGSERIACLGAAVWGVCPAHQATVGWFSVYGQSLATMLTLIVLRDAIRPGPVARGRLVRWGVVALLGTMCFGIGLGVALVLPGVLWLLNPAVGARPAARTLLLGFPLLPVALYLGLSALGASAHGDDPAGTPPFLALLSTGWQPILALLPQLPSAGLAWLALGLAFPHGPYPGVGATIVTVLAAVATGLALAFGTSHERRRIAAFALLALGVYLTVALGRGILLTIGFGPAALGETPRYHYLGTLALTGMLCVALAWAGDRLSLQGANAVLVAGLATVLALVLTSDHQIDHHDDIRTEVEEVTAAVERAAALGTMGRRTYIQNRGFRGAGLVPASIFPGWVGVFMIFHPTNVVDGRYIRFVGDARALAAGAPHGRLASLLVIPRPAPTPIP